MLNKIIREDLEYIVKQDLAWGSFSGANVLIAGANGYLAAYLIETLLWLNDQRGLNCRVFALVRSKEKARQRFFHHQERKDLEFVFQDVNDPIINDKKIGFDYIVHAAGQSKPNYYVQDPVGTLSVNTIGTMNLLKLARKDSLKGFLFFSTGGVYGKVPDHLLPMKETDYGYLDPLDVRSCYNESKRMGENICVSWQSQYGLPVKIARISYVYGPGMDLDDERVFPSFVAKIVRGEDIIMNSQGKATRAFCYIADATLAFFTILLKGKEGDAYNVGVEKETSVLELAKILIDLSPSQKLRLIIEPTDDPHHRADTSMQRSCLAIDRIKKLGWAPIYDLPEGCRRTVQSYL